MAAACHDDVIMHRDAKALSCLNNLACDIDVLATGRWIARGMIVDHPNSPCKHLIIKGKISTEWEVEPLIGSGPMCAIVIITLDHPRAR